MFQLPCSEQLYAPLDWHLWVFHRIQTEAGRCVSAGTFVLNYGATNMEPTQKGQPLLSSKTGPHLHTYKRPWKEWNSGHGSRRGPKPRTTLLARSSSNLLEPDLDRRTEIMVQHTGEKNWNNIYHECGWLFLHIQFTSRPRALAQAASRRLLTRRLWFSPEWLHMECTVDELAVKKAFELEPSVFPSLIITLPSLRTQLWGMLQPRSLSRGFMSEWALSQLSSGKLTFNRAIDLLLFLLLLLLLFLLLPLGA
jgi:hypothetical protein